MWEGVCQHACGSQRTTCRLLSLLPLTPRPAELSQRPRQQIMSFLPKNKGNLRKKYIREKYTYRVPAFHGRRLERERTHPKPVMAVRSWDRVTQPVLSKPEPFQMATIYQGRLYPHSPLSNKYEHPKGELYTSIFLHQKPEKGCYRNAPQMPVSSGRLELVLSS